MIKLIWAAILMPFPMVLKRFLMRSLMGYQIHKSAKIGFSLIYPRELTMGEGAIIGSFSLIKSIKLEMGHFCMIGRGNWITGYPKGGERFILEQERVPILVMGEHSAITNRHIIDCTDSIFIGSFSTIAGWMSQLLTHSIDVEKNRQSCKPIKIGKFCFVGTGVIILGGSDLPDYSILGAGSVLNKKFTEKYKLFAGVPAKEIKTLPMTYGYFNRDKGFVS